MPEIVCDTSSLQYLHQLGLLHLLPALGQPVVIPPAVEHELLTGQDLGIRPLIDHLQALRFRVSTGTRTAVLALAGEND